MPIEEAKGKGARPESKPDVERGDHLDLFVTNSMFPEASAVFTSRPISLAEARDTACIVLDTNALLVPYGIGAQTLSKVEATYQRLLKGNRLVIPAQVAREFAKNRVTRLAELYQRLSRKRNNLQQFQQGSYPLLEGLEEYRRLREVEEQLDRLTGEYRQLLTAVTDHVSSWEWNDPVSLLYSKLFRAEVVLDIARPLDEVRQEHLRRFLNKIPPGYKDEAKDDQGIGDLLIWLTILELGSTRRTSVIFVSGEEKADWWHRSEHQQLYPRFELVDEFRRASEGHSFHIIKFSRLLELFGASTQVVDEVRAEERVSTPELPLPRHWEPIRRGVEAEKGVAAWLIESGYEVTRAHRGARFDFLVEGPGAPFAVEVMYVANLATLNHRLRMIGRVAPDLPLTVVVVAERARARELLFAEKLWARLDPPFRLCTGLLRADGQFEVVRPLA